MLPQVILHNAVSADSKMDWINPDLDLYYKLAARWKEDTTLAGSDTVLNPIGEIPQEDESAFQPLIDDPADKRPILVVPDSGGRIRTWHYLKKKPHWKKCIALCTDNTPPNYFDYLKERHIEWITTGTENVDFTEALEELNARYNSQIVRVEGGGSLNGILLRSSLVSEVSLLIHPLLIGGTGQQSFFRSKDLTDAKGVINLKLIHLEKLQDDIIWMIYRVVKKKK